MRQVFTKHDEKSFQNAYRFGTLSCYVTVLSVANFHLFRSWFQGSWWTRTAAAYHPLHLFSESMVYKSICKRIDSRIEHDQGVSDRKGRRTEFIVAIIHHQMEYQVCSPADPQTGADCQNHQGDSLP